MTPKVHIKETTQSQRIIGAGAENRIWHIPKILIILQMDSK